MSGSATALAAPMRPSADAVRDIVIVNETAYVNGGAAKVAIATALGLTRRGRNVHFLAATGPVDPELAQAGIDLQCLQGFEILSDPNRLRAASQGLWNVRAHRAMAELLEPLDPRTTVVHVHLWAKALSSSVVAAAAERGFHVVLTLHDYLYACPTGTLYNHRREAICELEPMSPRCIATNCDARKYTHKLWRTARHAISRTAGRFGTGIETFVALGELSLEVLRDYLPTGAAVRVVPNFVDIAMPAPAPVAANRCFVFSGRLVPEKGAVLAAEAAAVAEAPLTIVGDGEQRAIIAERYPQVDIRGWLPHADGVAALREARALVFPSRWLEVQPLVLLEAAANGVPVIVADRCAARDVVEDGVTGLWFRSGDVRDLAEKIGKLRDPAYAERLGRAAHERYWSAPLGLERHLESLESVYAEALDRRNASQVR